MSETPGQDHIATARKMLRTVETARLFAKAAQIITAPAPVSGSAAADVGTLTLLREELRRREFGTLSDADIVQIAHRYAVPAVAGTA